MTCIRTLFARTKLFSSFIRFSFFFFTVFIYTRTVCSVSFWCIELATFLCVALSPSLGLYRSVWSCSRCYTLNTSECECVVAMLTATFRWNFYYVSIGRVWVCWIDELSSFSGSMMDFLPYFGWSKHYDCRKIVIFQKNSCFSKKT